MNEEENDGEGEGGEVFLFTVLNTLHCHSYL